MCVWTAIILIIILIITLTTTTQTVHSVFNGFPFNGYKSHKLVTSGHRILSQNVPADPDVHEIGSPES